jgi:hypothetical protein
MWCSWWWWLLLLALLLSIIIIIKKTMNNGVYCCYYEMIIICGCDFSDCVLFWRLLLRPLFKKRRSDVWDSVKIFVTTFQKSKNLPLLLIYHVVMWETNIFNFYFFEKSRSSRQKTHATWKGFVLNNMLCHVHEIIGDRGTSSIALLLLIPPPATTQTNDTNIRISSYTI